MRGVVMHTAGDVRVEEREDPKIVEPTDAVIRLAATCICGSDLWPYRGVEPADHLLMGHEYVGVVEEVGDGGAHGQARGLRRRVLRHLRQHLRDLPGRLPVQVRARRVCARHDRHPGRAGPYSARGRHARGDPGAAGRKPDPGTAGGLRCAGYGLVRRRRRPGRAWQDRRSRRRRRRRPDGHPRRRRARRGADHRDVPSPRAAEARPLLRRHRHRRGARRGGRRQGSRSSPAGSAPTP